MSLTMGITDNSPTGKLIRNIMRLFSEFERYVIIQRTQEGKAIALQNTNFRSGSPKKFSKAKINQALELLQTHSCKQIVAMIRINMATLVWIINCITYVCRKRLVMMILIIIIYFLCFILS